MVLHIAIESASMTHSSSFPPSAIGGRPLTSSAGRGSLHSEAGCNSIPSVVDMVGPASAAFEFEGLVEGLGEAGLAVVDMVSGFGGENERGPGVLKTGRRRDPARHFIGDFRTCMSGSLTPYA